MYKKPKLSEQERQRLNDLYKFLMKQDKPCSKEELCSVLGWKYTTSNERKIRDLISQIAKKVPVIATSDSSGYYIAKYVQDLERAEHQWKEIDSRQFELEERKQKLIEFCEKVRGINNG